MSYLIFGLIYGMAIAVGVIIGRQTIIERIERNESLSLPNLWNLIEKRQRIERRVIWVCLLVIVVAGISIVNSLTGF